MKKLIIFTLMFLFLFSYVSAVRVDYSPNDKGVKDMKAVVKDTILWDLIAVGEQGTMELKSHKTPTEVIEVGTGWQVTMIYDTNFGQAYKDILGNVYFYDLRTGEEVEREYKFVYWGEEIRQREVCNEYKNITNSTFKELNYTTECVSYVNESYTYEGWLDYNSKDLPKGHIKLGLMTNVLYKDKIDGVWEIHGKKIDKHAGWTSELSTGLVSYYKLDETSGTTANDAHGSNDGTNYGATINVAGKIDKAYDFDGRNDYVILTGLTSTSGSYSFSTWVNLDTISTDNLLSPWFLDSQSGRFVVIIGERTTGQLGFFDGSFRNFGVSASTGTWQHLVWVFDGTNNEAKMYINGVKSGTTEIYNSRNLGGTIHLGKQYSDNNHPVDGKIDEVGIWSRALSSTEVSELYNSGNGISYGGLNISLLSPENYYNSSSLTIDFSANLTDKYNLGVTNVSLVINDTIYDTNTSGLTGIYNFSETLSDGFYEWYVEAYDDTDEYYTSETRYFTIDTTPFIEFVSPTPENASNLSVPYIPVNVSVTEDYFENVTFYFYKGGELNESITFTDDTRFYNKTGCTCANWEINATVCTTTGKCNSTETRSLIIDILAPEIEILSPVTSYDYLYLNQTIDLNVSITDASDHLDSCWYKYPDENYRIYSNYFYSPFENVTIDTYSYLIANVTPSGGLFPTTTTYELGYCNNLTFSDEDATLYLRCDDEEPINLGFIGDWGRNVNIYGYNLTYFNCSENQTFNYIPDKNTLTVYANDTFGNEKNESVSWGYKLLVLDTIYDEEAISTKYNDITLVTKTQGDTTLNTVTLKYNNSNVATVETQDGNYSNFTARVHKAVNTEQVFNFSYNVTLQYPSLPSTNFEINHYNQTYVPLFFGRCNATYDTNAVNFTVYEEGTSTELNASHESNLRLWIDGTGNSIYQLATYQNLAQNESNYDFCISPTDETFYSSGLVSNYRDDADRRDYLLNNFSLNNESQEIPLYLAFTSETDIVTLIVYDSNYNYLEDATIYVQRWIVGTETFENVAILDTDSNGKTFINLILYNVYYRFLVYYDGKLVKTTSSERLSSTTKEIPVVLGPDDNYEPFDNIIYDLTFNNATNVVTFSFIDSSGALASGCLKVYNSTIFGEVLLSSECSTSASATISSLLETNNTYIIRGIITLDDDYDEVSRIKQLIITIGDNISSETMGSYGYMLAILLLGTMFVVGVSLGYPEISFITTGIVMIFINMLGWLAIPTEVLVLYLSIFLLFIIIGGKK